MTMNVPTMQETPTAARVKLREYRTALHKHADAEYQQLEQAYAQMAKGRQLIRLSEAFAAAPLDDKNRVRLAVAPATWKQVKLVAFNNGFRFAFHTTWGRPPRWQQSVLDPRGHWQTGDGFALVPIVPPTVRGRHDMAKCCVLWEVEQWADSVIRATPDRDPLLIRRIGDDLYAVLGEWNATPLEQAIAAGRRLT